MPGFRPGIHDLMHGARQRSWMAGRTPAMTGSMSDSQASASRQKLGAVFEMHGVVVIPLAAPDEAVLLEDLDDLPGDAVLVRIFAVDGAGVAPIIGPGDVDVDGRAVAVDGGPGGAGDDAAIIGAA